MEENFLFRSSLKRVKEVINLNRVFNYLGDDVYDETLSEIILPEFSRNTVTEKLLVSREKVSHYEIRFKRVFVAQVFPTRCKNTYLQNLDWNWKNYNLILLSNFESSSTIYSTMKKKK